MLRVRSVEFWIDACQTRIPFRFGMTTMERAPLLTARVEIVRNGETSHGFAADLLVPKWFEKNPNTTVAADRVALVESARAAADAWCEPGQDEATAFDHWWRVYGARVQSVPEQQPDRLMRGFGVALVERAVLDATCRAVGLSFHRALRDDLFGFRPGEVHAELTTWSLADSLGERPLDSVAVRHTVGLADPLRGAEGPADGLPGSLEENARRYGLEFFKVKIGGDADADLARLTTIAAVLTEVCPNARWTADGNEQFEDPGALARTLDALERTPEGAAFLGGLLYVEQPIPRALSFDPRNAAGLGALTSRVPVIIDEADHGIEAFPRALELGYRGVSVKNCKGVFRAMLNRGLCDVRGGGAFQSAEDLTNLGILPLQQDLATVASLGLPHVERNGHHYFRGLDHLPAAEAESALGAHAGLYEPLEGGGAGLRIRSGRLDLTTLQAPGFGYSVDVRVEERTPVEDWREAEAAR